MCHLPIRPCVLGLKNQRFTDHRQRHEINCGGGLIDYNHRLFSKADNFDGNRSIPMMGSSLREDRIREMLEREIEFLPGTDYLKILRSGISGLDSKGLCSLQFWTSVHMPIHELLGSVLNIL